MAKAGKRNRPARQPPRPPEPVAAAPGLHPQQVAEKIQVVHAEAVAGAPPDVIEGLTPPPPPPAGVDLEQCWRLASTAQDLFAERQRRAEQAQAKAEEARREHEALKGAVQQQHEALRNDEQRLRERSAALEQRETELARRELDLASREADARAGFAARSRQALAALLEEQAELELQLAATRKAVAGERAAWREEAAAARAALERELELRREEHAAALAREADEARSVHAIERDELAAARQELARQRVQLEEERRGLELGRELLRVDETALPQKVERLAAARADEAIARAGALEEQLAAVRAERDRLYARMVEREESDRRFQGRTPEEVLAELGHLAAQYDRLKAELARRPGPEVAQQLADLERERDTWEAERRRIVMENRRLQQDLSRRLIAVTELETLRDHRTALEASNRLLQEAVREVRADVESLTGRTEAERVFPACHEMDEDFHLQRESGLDMGPVDLGALVTEVQQRIAASDPPLYYSLRDLRAFLGGLAMSRLHILQGISGTGKTSLPLAFARAVGAGFSLVEVQAGWRDRHDLIGHYNAFERRFHETEFLQALYRAQCPAFRDRLFVVVLDEMNLSHPEHYFADLLSALEQNPRDQRIALLTAAADPAPAGLVEGRFLPIPPNVWMVGTANHDETTREFADKTYDRAHVMELPRHREQLVSRALPAREPLSRHALATAFDRACTQYGRDCDQDYRVLEDELAEVLASRFQVGWGNRLQRQMQRFYPVARAAGASRGEAVDHLLATRLLRKLRDRHGVRADDLLYLRDLVQQAGERIDRGAVFDRSLALLGEELARHGMSDEEAANR